jgi:hypothetical protein
VVYWTVEVMEGKELPRSVHPPVNVPYQAVEIPEMTWPGGHVKDMVASGVEYSWSKAHLPSRPEKVVGAGELPATATVDRAATAAARRWSTVLGMDGGDRDRVRDWMVKKSESQVGCPTTRTWYRVPEGTLPSEGMNQLRVTPASLQLGPERAMVDR